MSPRFTLLATCLATGLAQTHFDTQAQTTTTVVVTGNPLRDADPMQPTSVLSGDALTQRRASTLGETLDNLPGVSATQFGPNASRPIVRGQDGDRIRVLNNSGATLDASALSYDHALPIDPLVLERVEVLRGAAALLYGGGAVGGVVNTLDNRIPTWRPEALQFRAEGRAGGASQERAGVAVLDTPLGRAGGVSTGGWVLHADAFGRQSSDLRVPGFSVVDADGVMQQRTRVVNSASRGEGGALGLSWVGAQGHAGLSMDTLRNRYGVVVEEDVTIRMLRDRLATAGEWRLGTGFFDSVRWQGAHTRYRHEEVEGSGDVGTVFSNRGNDLRVEALQREQAAGAGRWGGVWGLQTEQSTFAALGEEAFVPTTRTRTRALFTLQTFKAAAGSQLSLGLRGESVRVQSEGDAPGADEARFGAPRSRQFDPRSIALAVSLPVATDWRVKANLSRHQRAPSSSELFANGVHVATGTFERGDPAATLETGRSADLTVQWQAPQAAGHRFSISLFNNRFDRYIVLLPTGEPDVELDDGHSVPVLGYRGVPARLRGFEAEAQWRLRPGLTLSAQIDGVRGDNLAQNGPLPRLAPVRTTLGLQSDSGPWQLKAEVRHAARQGRVADGDLPTPAWTQVNLDAAYVVAWGRQMQARWFLRAHNLTDALATHASSLLSVRQLSPMPGRALMVGLRVSG